MSASFALPTASRADDDVLVCEHLPLVRKVAARIGRRLPRHVSTEDLVSAGVVGLLEARHRFDHDRQRSFAAFAEFRIRGAILDELRRRHLMARDAHRESRAIEAAVSRVTQELGRVPEEHEIAAHLGLSPEALRTKLARLTPVQVIDIHAIGGADVRPSAADTFEEVARRELVEQLRESIDKLSERHQQILHLYYRQELKLREIGAVLGVTESRVCQLLAEVTLRLRAMLDDRRRDGTRHG